MPKINKLPDAGELTGNEEIPIFQDGKTARTSVAELVSHVAFSAGELANMDLSERQDGDIIYFNEAEDKWQTKRLSADVDGGTY